MIPFRFGMTGFWLILMILLLIVEAAAPGLVSVWFAAGAFAAMIAAAFKLEIWLQIVVFVCVSVLSLILTKPLVKKFVNGKIQPTNADRIIGRECIVKETIDNLAGTGTILVEGVVWTARSANETVAIPGGARVIVDRIDGVKAIVHSI